MPIAKSTIIRGGLETLYFSGAHAILQPIFGGVGAILTLHHVRPARDDAFQPNRLLEVTPEFLTRIVMRIVEAGVDIISLDEMHRRMAERDFERRFVCFTFDDAYRDTKDVAYPILRRYGIPFAVYVPTSFIDRAGELWWLALERIVAKTDSIECVIDGAEYRLVCDTVEAKRETFDRIYWWLRGLLSDDDIRLFMRELCRRYDVDLASFCSELCVSWDELTELASDPLVTVGSHTISHPILSKLADGAVHLELQKGRRLLEAKLDRPVHHLAYPFGDRLSAGPREFAIATEHGFRTAVTNRPGTVYSVHRQYMTALPRISINGEFQQERYLRVLMSGVATALWNGFRRVNAA